MIRKIIKIDKEKCDGCGLCIDACHEGAIGLEDGKAVLLKDDYCDGLGNCLPVCPVDAISFEEREAAEFDEEAVKKNMQQKVAEKKGSELRQWPIQIKLVPVNAPYFEGAHLLVAADCTAFSYGDFHQEFMKDKIILVGCPKLDEGDYSEKLTEIIKENNIKSVAIVRMEVPCCKGIEAAAMTALKKSGKMIPWSIHVVTIDGKIQEN